MPPKRMTANPVQAPRHRPGKVVEEADSSDSDASDEETSTPSAPSKIPAPPKASTAGGITSNLSKVDLNERRKIAAAKEAARIEEEKVLKAKEEEGFVTEEEEDESEEGSEEESGSEDEESSEEEEAPRRVLMRPTFIKKDKRNAITGSKSVDTRSAEEIAAEEERRKKEAADAIVEEQIRKDIAARAAGKKNWDDEEADDEVDDEDGLDPDAEYAAWKLRELKRIKREREAIEEREKELEEVERRKNLTEEERRREDDEFIAKQKEEKDGKGKMGFMQKYYHKGAFYQDDAEAQGLGQRDIMGSKFADDVNRELLPQALQMRDMTKLGKKGATKYKDLKSEDTGKWGQFDDRPRREGMGFNTDERFMPDRDRDRAGPGASGANSMPVADRKKVTGAPEGPRAMRDGGERERERSRDVDTYRPGRERSRSRSRSRSPRRDREDRYRRKRSTSRDGDRYESDKRRRVDSR
ncbi:micro-fibrillar-associated protein 1 [Leptodontidium sp. MPI-SDFR-AT-0119]|nr:micro-fibrillar-associated protein 1 [Leptodontidium sp. MPI-SDFR-AT-0119]